MTHRVMALGIMLVMLAAPLAACGRAPAVQGMNDAPYPTRTPLATAVPGPAPERSLPLLGGGEASLATWRGKGVIVNFWASWCGPCRLEMPDLAAVHTAHEDIVVVGVNHLEDAETARAFVEEFGLPFPILLDEDGWLGSDMKVRGLPTTFYVDAAGQIVGSHIGPLDAASLSAIVERLQP